MKQALLILFLSAAMLAAAPKPASYTSSGIWASHSLSVNCGSASVCAEWLSYGDPRDGSVCCIGVNDLHSTSYSACQTLVRGPRPTGDPML